MRNATRWPPLQDYPRRPMPWPSTWSSCGPEKGYDIADYAAALRRAAARTAGGDVDEPALGALSVELVDRLQVWRAVHTADFLAGRLRVRGWPRLRLV